MANFPGGAGVLPGVYSDFITASRGVSIPGGNRVAAIIGEGSTDETVVSQATGKGLDGLNALFSSTSGADGRHFQMSNFPYVKNRTTIYKNGIPLVGYEGIVDNSSFSGKYDYRLDINTGRLELQKASLADQGGSFYSPLNTNVGQGSLENLILEDANALKETWTIRCVSVQRNPSNLPVAGTAKFLAFGSVSGSLSDANGNPIVWVADGYTASNGIISFSIQETKVLGNTASSFREGDAFLVKINSGVLSTNDSLTANYLPVLNINDPILTQGMNDVVNRHGLPSLNNTLSLGAQLAYSNAASVLMTLQAAPSMPRRTSYILSPSVNSLSTSVEDFIFPLPLDVVPYVDGNIHFFVVNNSTEVETQVLPNKLDFYTLDTPGNPTTAAFVNDTTPAPGGFAYFYTVKESLAALNSGFDGYLGRITSTTGVFNSSIQFNSTYVGKKLRIEGSQSELNKNTYTITGVLDGKLYVTSDANPYSGTTNNQNNVAFQFIEPSNGTTVPNSSATDGVFTVNASTTTATLSSASLVFGNIPSFLNRRVKISGSTLNNGLYDIVSYDGVSDTLTLSKAISSEGALGFEILDPNDASSYIVVNKAVVPNGFGLRVSLIQDADADFYDAGWINALSTLETIECDMVVPLPKQTISTVFQNTLAHCKAMSNIRNKKERVMLTGAIRGLTPANLIGTRPAAVENIGVLEGIQGDQVTEILAGNIEDLADYSVPNAFGNTYRCIYFYPDEIVVNANGQNVFVDGFYAAAAAAGWLSASVRVEMPLTNKVLSGFTILRNKQLSPTTLEQLAAAGVCVLQPVAGGGICKWGITTSQSGYVEEQEASIIFIRDKCAKQLRVGFNGYVGNPEDENMQANLNTRAVILLNSLVSQRLITDYKDLVVVRDAVNPSQWNISCRVKPNYPTNFIYLKISVGDM